MHTETPGKRHIKFSKNNKEFLRTFGFDISKKLSTFSEWNSAPTYKFSNC